MSTLLKAVKFVSKGGGALKLGGELLELAIPGAIGKLARKGAITPSVVQELRTALTKIMTDDDLVEAGVETVAEVVARGPFEVDDVAANAAAWALGRTADIVADAGGGKAGANALAVTVIDAADAIVKREGQGSLSQVVGEMDDLADAGWTEEVWKYFLKTDALQKNSDWFRKLGKVLAIAGAAGATIYALGDELMDEDEDSEEGGSAGLVTSPGKEDTMNDNNDLAQGDIIASAQVINQVRAVLRSLNISPQTLIALLNILGMPRNRLLEALSVIQSS
jgi:hypothetical protein